MTIQDNDRFQRLLDDRANKRSGFRILVVDDEPSILELVKTALETLESYQVLIATNAKDALEIVANADTPFDCFLLDIQMPEMDGIELLRELRSLPAHADTPILMLTAMSDRTYIDDAFLEGATDYLNKPFDFLELRNRIKCAYQLVKARRETEQSLQCASDLKNQLRNHQQFSFEDPFKIPDADGFLRYIEFDNYVAQLARRKLFNSQAVSIKLQDAELFYNLAGCNAFCNAVYDVARCIQSATHDMEHVVSYRGSGVFLCIFHGATSNKFAFNAEILGERIGAQLREHVADDRIEVLVGQSVSMRVLSRTSATNALQKAVDAVQHLEDELRKHEDVQHFNVADTHITPAKGDKRLYERVLLELFGEESYLNVR